METSGDRATLNAIERTSYVFYDMVSFFTSNTAGRCLSCCLFMVKRQRVCFWPVGRDLCLTVGKCICFYCFSIHCVIHTKVSGPPYVIREKGNIKKREGETRRQFSPIKFIPRSLLHFFFYPTNACCSGWCYPHIGTIF